MANKDFLAPLRVHSPLIDIPLGFYDSYGPDLPETVTLVNDYGECYYGTIFKHTHKLVYLYTDAKKILEFTSLKRKFAIIRLTYISTGTFKLFVPEETNYWVQHSPPIRGLLPYPNTQDEFDEYEAELKVYEAELEEVAFEMKDLQARLDEGAYDNNSICGYTTSNPDSELLGYNNHLDEDYFEYKSD